jgi:hypothetical protein
LCGLSPRRLLPDQLQPDHATGARHIEHEDRNTGFANPPGRLDSRLRDIALLERIRFRVERNFDLALQRSLQLRELT